MMNHYYSVIAAVLLASNGVSGQGCTTPQFDQKEYRGHIEIQDDQSGPTFYLVGDRDATKPGINIVMDCTEIDITISTPQYLHHFVIDKTRVIGTWQIVLSPAYNLITNTEIRFIIKACTTEPQQQCVEADVVVTFPYNAHPPTFNKPFGEAAIDDTETCADAGCSVIFEPPFIGFDSDGDTVLYSILPFTEHSNLFEIVNNQALEIRYKGYGVSQASDVTLLLKAEDNRPALDSRSTVALVKIKLGTTATTIAPSPPTTTPGTTTTPECDDKNKKIYFIAMIALASVLGAVLLLLLLIPLCIRCCRPTRLGISSSRKSTVKKSGVYTAGASYKSFSEMNYVTLGELPPSYNSSPELGVRVENHSSGRVRSRPKSSARDLPPQRSSFSSNSTASAQDRRRENNNY